MDFTNFQWGGDQEQYVNQYIDDINQYSRFFEVEPGDLVVDIGASWGPFTYNNLDKGAKHFFCFEPSRTILPLLVKNTMGHPVTHISKAISNSDGQKFMPGVYYEGPGGELIETIKFSTFLKLYGIERIDFLKTDCEGGEYDIFCEENMEFIKSKVKKIVGEWHLSEVDKERFRNFRDNILPQFPNFEVFSLNGVNIKWDLWNEHFIEYYTCVIFHIDNREQVI